MDDRTFLTNLEAMETSAMFRAAKRIEPEIMSDNREVLETSYHLTTCRKISQEAWGVVFAAIVRGEPGFAKFQLLPVDIVTSPLCIGVLLENDPLFLLALNKKISYTGIVKLAYQKGIWAY